MAPRGFTLPSAQTASAKSARSAFFCPLCQKGYSRMNEFEAHESSYDHLHKKRLKEMKEMQRQVGTSNSREKEEKGGPLVKIQLGSAAGAGGKNGGGEGKGKIGGGGFKKGGFKSAFAPVENEDNKTVKSEAMDEKEKEDQMIIEGGEKMMDIDDSDITDEEDYYDPRKPTGCMPDCRGRVQVSAR